jgi:hypothetical protein
MLLWQGCCKCLYILLTLRLEVRVQDDVVPSFHWDRIRIERLRCIERESSLWKSRACSRSCTRELRCAWFGLGWLNNHGGWAGAHWIGFQTSEPNLMASASALLIPHFLPSLPRNLMCPPSKDTFRSMSPILPCLDPSLPDGSWSSPKLPIGSHWTHPNSRNSRTPRSSFHHTGTSRSCVFEITPFPPFPSNANSWEEMYIWTSRGKS